MTHRSVLCEIATTGPRRCAFALATTSTVLVVIVAAVVVAREERKREKIRAGSGAPSRCIIPVDRFRGLFSVT